MQNRRQVLYLGEILLQLLPLCDKGRGFEYWPE
jgi:hypothetical protein